MTNPSELLRKNRADLSNFLIHLTKEGSYEEYKPFAKNPGSFTFGDSSTLNAEASLKAILSTMTMLARAPFGHFKFQINVGYKKDRAGVPLDWLKCVCFSEAPLSELKQFYLATQDSKNETLKRNKYQKYGIAFSTEFIRSKNGHPVFYFDSRRGDIVQSLNKLPYATPGLHQWKPLMPLFEQYGPKLHSPGDEGEINFTWEREWRIVGDLNFTLNQVAFGLCPEGKISMFEALVKNSFPFIDPDW